MNFIPACLDPFLDPFGEEAGELRIASQLHINEPVARIWRFEVSIGVVGVLAFVMQGESHVFEACITHLLIGPSSSLSEAGRLAAKFLTSHHL